MIYRHRLVKLLSLSSVSSRPSWFKVPTGGLHAILFAVRGDKLILLGQDVAALDLKLADTKLVHIEDMLSELVNNGAKHHGGVSITRAPSATSFAYVNFIPGSTGRPKRVQVEHKYIVRLAKQTNLHDLFAAVPLLIPRTSLSILPLGKSTRLFSTAEQ